MKNLDINGFDVSVIKNVYSDDVFVGFSFAGLQNLDEPIQARADDAGLEYIQRRVSISIHNMDDLDLLINIVENVFG